MNCLTYTQAEDLIRIQAHQELALWAILFVLAAIFIRLGASRSQSSGPANVQQPEQTTRPAQALRGGSL